MERRSLEALITLFCPLCDRADGGDELIEACDRLGLGRLDQHRSMDDQREIHRHRMEAFINQSLGKIECADAAGKAFVREDRFMHAWAALCERRIKAIFQTS